MAGYSSKRMKRYLKQPSTWGGLVSILLGAAGASGLASPDIVGAIIGVIGAVSVIRDEDGQAANRGVAEATRTSEGDW